MPQPRFFTIPLVPFPLSPRIARELFTWRRACLPLNAANARIADKEPRK